MASIAREELTKGTVEFFFHHLFLPPKLPSGDDLSTEKESHLINFVHESLCLFLSKTNTTCGDAVNNAKSMMEYLRDARGPLGYLHENGVRNVLQQISSAETLVPENCHMTNKTSAPQNILAPLHVRAQNAAVLIRLAGASVIFELFELSPTNVSVNSTKGRLVRQFPGVAIAIPLNDFKQEAFQSVLANTLVKMSHQVVHETKTRTKKAKQLHDEERETVDPQIITELLSSFLRGLGKPVVVTEVCKNTREEVLWKQSKLPWRRSALWLLIRVSLQLTFERISVNSGQVYKSFMIFLLSRVLEAASQLDWSSDVLQTMTTKISRRLLKLTEVTPGNWLIYVRLIMSKTATLQKKRWQAICREEESPIELNSLKMLRMGPDTQMRLPDMDLFVTSITQRARMNQSSSFFSASYASPIIPEDLPCIPAAMSGDSSLPFHLAMVESWVANNLDAWIKAHKHDKSRFQDLCNLIKRYHDEACSQYTDNPEGASRMHLVILELWVAVDRATIDDVPLLRCYKNEVPVKVYQALLLSFRGDMERLHRVETYLDNRQKCSESQNTPSVFRSGDERMCFPVQYFAQSQIHQNLKKEIEEWAESKRQEKLKEFRSLRDKWNALMQSHRETQCDEVEIEDYGIRYSRHSESCNRCKVLAAAENLCIEVHEWPLSEDAFEAQTTVFELALPMMFCLWRDVTLYLIDNVLRGEDASNESAPSLYPLRKYDDLQRFSKSDTKWRIHLVSSVKPHVATHRRRRYIGQSSEKDVCLNNGHRFRYFDEDRGKFLAEFSPSLQLSGICTLQLPFRSKALTQFLIRDHNRPTGETPNQVLANQTICPEHITLGEFKALATLPFGYHLQWISVLTQLAMPEVDFNKTEVAIFLLQLSLQAGPRSPSQPERHAHARLCDPGFVRAMINQLHDWILRIEENWQSHTSLWVFTFLTARLLSLASNDLKRQLLGFLEKSRKISYSWSNKLRDKAHETPDQQHRDELLHIRFRICLICMDSFNVEDTFLRQILSESTEAAVLVETSIDIRNNSQYLQAATAEYVDNLMYNRWIYTLHRVRPILIDEVITTGNSCLDLAVKRCWPAFDRQNRWQLAVSSQDWLITYSTQLEVHFNILTGELLVNGVPLSRLPRHYEDHHDYQKLFGGIVLDVMPSSYPGMSFCCTRTFEGHNVHFGMMVSSKVDHNDLLIRLEIGGVALDLVPSRVFQGQIPHSFVKNYVHWYNHSTKAIEFRPLKRPWNFDPGNWVLKSEPLRWNLTQGRDIFLISPSSNTAERIAAILSPLEASLDLHLLLEKRSNVLEVKIPSLELEFLLTCGESAMRCRQFRGMQVDASQSIGTLIGFASKLVLCDSRNPESRMILVPEGKVQYNESSAGHVRTYVPYGTSSRVQRYSVDSLLRRLVDNTTVTSRLYLALIHALTSYCLPDLFTGRTGTEEALSILRSASVRSICSLTAHDMDLLDEIAALTPSRSFYPKHLQSMQTVTWSSELSFMTQDGRFLKAVNEIVDRATSLSFLYTATALGLKNFTHADTFLLEREIIRNSRQQVSGYGAEEFTQDHDVVYNSRDCRQNSERSVLASEFSYRISHGLQTLHRQVPSDFLDTLYSLISLEPQDVTNREISTLQTLEYDSAWLDSPSTYLPSQWCHLHYTFQRDQLLFNKFQLMIWFTTLSYGTDDPHLIQALLLLAVSTHVSAAPLPLPNSYRLSLGYEIERQELETTVRAASKELRECLAAYPPLPGESGKAAIKKRKKKFKQDKTEAIKVFIDRLVEQWPCKTPTQPTASEHNTYIRGSQAMAPVISKWHTWYANFQFKNYLEVFIQRLKSIHVEEISIPRAIERAKLLPSRDSRAFISIQSLFSNIPPCVESGPSLNTNLLISKIEEDDRANNDLLKVLDVLSSQTKFEYERRYLSELRHSVQDLQNRTTHQLKKDSLQVQAHIFNDHLHRCQSHLQTVYDSLQAIEPSSGKSSKDSFEREKIITSIVKEASFWPRVSPVLFLEQLGRSRWPCLNNEWTAVIVAYGIAITTLQQAERLLQAQNNDVDLFRELENTGHKTWDPAAYPEWLLLECESGIIIRDIQQQIAEQMISPQEDKNAVMQLNMGEGKSSVIIPIVASALSDGLQLVRVIVAKPQAKQMYQMLVSKLSGLIDRPIYQLPFSRAIKMSIDQVNSLRRLFKQCIKEGGVMMVQPEHLLSFQLMGLEFQIHGGSHVADSLLEMQRLFDSCSRDIVDESDENFSVKFELVYTIGLQRPIEHTPDRWGVIQEVLGRFSELARQEKNNFPESIDLDDRGPGRYPRIRILRPDAEAAILQRLTKVICDTGMVGFPIALQSKQIIDAVHIYILNPHLSLGDINAVEGSSFWNEAVINHILLLRGLISGGVLAFAFGQKRWRVDYGTDPNRERKTRLAVPFRAKDNPTPRSEFSHPDVVIILTCLSYYYKGLEDDDIFSALELLIRSDNADVEYQAWVDTAPNLPLPYQQLAGINLQDREECISNIFPCLRYSKGTIDYFLSRMVFAKESREFPHKLSASGWDLAKAKTKLTTGFSGTNDSRYVLPLNMRQLDLPEQTHTNALVLKYLLGSENGIMLMPQTVTGASLESNSLLHMVEQMSSNTRVILDVGAQIIDLDNLQFATLWLSRYKDDHLVEAVVFFSDHDELVVLEKSGKIESLQTSPFSNQLDQCLVFLDEAHTRGTDLRLPENYQAAVTLGANLTKDKLVQACMRMRKLGKGQSVVFCIPREIEQKICTRKVSESSTTSEITVSDVLCWAISETWLDLRRSVPLWLNQGVRFYEQQDLWNEHVDSGQTKEDIKKWATSFLEDEAQSLDCRYRPKALPATLPLSLQRRNPTMHDHFQQRCQDFGLTDFRLSSLQEEQERELSPETEREQQVEVPPSLDPLPHSCHKDLKRFVQGGEFPTSIEVVKPAFMALANTSAANHLDVNQFPNHVFVTKDFAKTVQTLEGDSSALDLYQRPVHWILTSTSVVNVIDRLVIISPYEAQELLPDIEVSNHVTLSIYAPRSRFGFRALDQLDLYNVPQRQTQPIITEDMVVQLNLFAGQIYLSSFAEYVNVCDRLGLAWRPMGDSVIIGPDGFIPPNMEGSGLVNISGFTTSPVKFLRVLITRIRKNCEAIDKTHMGKILNGVLLLEDDFVQPSSSKPERDT